MLSKNSSPKRFPDSSNEPHVVQSQRLLRVLLGEKNIVVNKASVDRALQNYAQLLRQLQASRQQQQQQQPQQQHLVLVQQQQQQIAEQQQRIVQLENALERQQSITQTALEIKDVELDICTRERDQKTLQLRQYSWKLAKERTAARDKDAAHTAASSSLTQRAETAEQAAKEQQSQIHSLELLIKRSVSALRNKDMVLKQLLEQRACCGVGQQTADSSIAEVDETDLQENALEIAKLQQESEQLCQQLEQEKQQPEDDHVVGSEVDTESEATPVMGQNLISDDEEMEIVDGGKMENAQYPGGDEEPLRVSTVEWERRVHEMHKQLLEANESIAALEDEKATMKEDFEETLREREEKMTHMKGVLIACNERRKAAEVKLKKVGHFDKGDLREITQQHPEDLINDIVKQEIATRVNGDSAVVEIERLKRLLVETEKEKVEAERKLEQLENFCREVVNEISELEKELEKYKKKLVRAEQKEEKLHKEYSERLEEARLTIEILTKCVQKTREDEDTTSNHQLALYSVEAAQEVLQKEYSMQLEEARRTIEYLTKCVPKSRDEGVTSEHPPPEVKAEAAQEVPVIPEGPKVATGGCSTKSEDKVSCSNGLDHVPQPMGDGLSDKRAPDDESEGDSVAKWLLATRPTGEHFVESGGHGTKMLKDQLHVPGTLFESSRTHSGTQSQDEPIQEKLEQALREVAELRKKLDDAEARQSVANGKLIYLRQIVQAVVSTIPHDKNC